MRSSRPVLSALLALALACSAVARPAPFAAGEPCGWCRMALADRHLAAQLAAPSEEPRFFDDIGCLRDYLRAQKALPRGTAAYVADHVTGEWIPAWGAIYTRVAVLETPMGSHLIAHRDATSLARDRRAAGGVVLTAQEVFGPAGPPRGAP